MILRAQSLGFTLEEIKGALADTKRHGLRHDYLIGQIARKLTELDRHIVQAQALRARLVCASNDLKARLKNGANCDGRTAALAPAATIKPRPVRRVDRRTPAIAG